MANKQELKVMKLNTVEFNHQDLPFNVAEEIKLLRTNIQYSGADTKVIFLTSADQSDGKSTISFELACSMAELGKKTLLLDTDMRRSAMHTRIDGNKPQGLSYYLSGQAELETVLCRTNITNLYSITAGRVPPNPAELLSSKRMRTLIEWARENYDYIIVDTPPINLVADAAVMASMSDTAIVVIKANKTPRKSAQNVIKLIEKTECPILGVVLNQVSDSGSGYYKKYGYGGDYYGEAVDEKKFKSAKPVVPVDELNSKSSDS